MFEKRKRVNAAGVEETYLVNSTTTDSEIDIADLELRLERMKEDVASQEKILAEAKKALGL